jgi:hypothetical protein
LAKNHCCNLSTYGGPCRVPGQDAATITYFDGRLNSVAEAAPENYFGIAVSPIRVMLDHRRQRIRNREEGHADINS